MIPPPNIFGEPLTIDEVLVDFDGPQLFSARSASGRIFVAMHAPPEDTVDNWLYVEVSRERLHEFLQEEVSARVLFGEPESGKLHIVRFNTDRSVSASEVAPIDLPLNYLPDELVAKADLPPFLADNIPSKLSGEMWEVEPEVVRYLKSIRTPVEIAARRTGRVVADMIFGSETERMYVSLPALGSVLTTGQKLIDVLGQKDVSAKGPIPLSTRQWTQLDAVAVFPSSFGLRIESHQAAIIDQTEGRVALEKLVQLLSAGSNQKRLAELLPQVGRRAALQYKAFAKALDRSGAGIELHVGFPSERHPLEAKMSASEVSSLQYILDSETTTIEDVTDFRGRLMAVSLRTKFFLIESDDESYSGRIADECLSKVDGLPIGGVYSVKIRIVTNVDETTGDMTEKFILVDVET